MIAPDGPRVVVLGGGISGLAAAFYLRRESAQTGKPLQITVLEKSPKFGGCIQTVRESGYLMELGPDSVLTHKPWGMELFRDLGLESAMLPVQPGRAGVLRGRRVLPIPSDFRLFAPSSLPSIAASGLLSLGGVVRAAEELSVAPREDESDESLASFVTRRFGREILDRLAQPLIGGVYSGDPEHLSMKATLPDFLAYERKYGSLIRAMSTMRRAAASGQKKNGAFVTPVDGLGSVIAALERELSGSLRSGVDVTGIRSSRTASGATEWNVTCADGSVVTADALVCALPARIAAGLLEPENGSLAWHLGSISYNSVATISMSYDDPFMTLSPSCYGFVVPYAERRSITAATIVSRKYPGRAPEGKLLIRAFAGGALQPALLDLDDDELIEEVRRDITEITGVSGTPSHTHVTRWMQQFPEYRVGHTELVDVIEREASALPGFALAGNAYRGAGIPDCIHSGKTAAQRIATHLSAA